MDLHASCLPPSLLKQAPLNAGVAKVLKMDPPEFHLDADTGEVVGSCRWQGQPCGTVVYDPKSGGYRVPHSPNPASLLNIFGALYEVRALHLLGASGRLADLARGDHP